MARQVLVEKDRAERSVGILYPADRRLEERGIALRFQIVQERGWAQSGSDIDDLSAQRKSLCQRGSIRGRRVGGSVFRGARLR